MNFANLRPLAGRVKSYFKFFRQQEDGAILIFSLIIFFLIILLGGVAVDMMRYENERARLQGTADRAVLAATTIRDNSTAMPVQDIVQAYFDAEGLGDSVRGRIEVTENAGTRTVRVSPQAVVPTFFMRLAGVETLEINLAAAAIEGLDETTFEIVLVLDVSDSMLTSTTSGRTRLEELQEATESFLVQMYDQIPAEALAITIVPYAKWVTPPAGFANHFTNMSNPDSTHACIDFSVWDDVRNSIDTPVTRIGQRCYNDAWASVQPMVGNLGAALSIVNNLETRPSTSVDLGVRFGGLFFDPSMRPAIDQMIDNGMISEDYRGLPRDWNDPLSNRALILMTDGRNWGRNVSPRDTNRTRWNERTIASCQALRNNGVTIYSVAFEAPDDGVELMEQCASSPNHTFNGSDGRLLNAFHNIATHIQTSALRLIQ